MIVIYTSPGCASCRKVKNWLKEHELKYIEKNIFNVLLNDKEVRYLLKRTENGSDDLISRRSKIIRDNNIDIDSMSVDELITFIINNPSVLKRPIIIDDRNMQFGYDSEEIETFIPRDLKSQVGCDKNCAHYDICGRLREEE